jgi:hypothetical protein
VSKHILQDWVCSVRKIGFVEGDSLIESAACVVADAKHVSADGWFCIEDSYAAALFVDEDTLKLQVGRAVFAWEESGLTVSWKQKGLHHSEVLVRSRKGEVLRLRYTSVASRAIAIGDMTVDAIDEETQDWWLWLSRCSSDVGFRKSILTRMLAGIK